MKTKAIGLVSGGLDSMIATKLMLDQKIEVVPIRFVSPFFHSEDMEKETADFLGLELKLIKVKDEYLSIVRNPEFGYGAALNPCIDCKIYMLKEAGRIMEETGASFIFTGEVLNQRPFSQRKIVFELMNKKTSLNGKILRPLSAQLLEPTEPEICGLVDRTKLLAISGRSRKPQMAVAEKLGITDYPQPAGGCLLTDKIYAEKLRKLLNYWGNFTFDDAEIIKHGRMFWCGDVLIVVGRNKQDNEILKSISKHGDVTVELKSIPCPLAVLRGRKIGIDAVEYAKNMVLHYTKKITGKNIEFLIEEVK
ncbi:MAG TPA: tRNA 4-thiouridine(8) synthase ThiI [bacterium]|nr:tRNA 4-thiouridine(8) synthase ThiI [bacterium]HOL34636.1 tRNA 4-thiouridine(8) synthase ThiI [bacterium]HPP08182.1 tRNA 4-thiouridine(8) synthase ThiI [bacterium]